MTYFTLISDSRIAALKIEETGDLLVDAAGQQEITISNKRAEVNPWYSLVRAAVLDRLLVAARSLPSGIRLCLEEGYRSIEVQKVLFDNYTRMLEAHFGPADADRIAEEATKYVARPDGVPPHSTGGAVDVTLQLDTGCELEMGSTSDDTPLRNGDNNYTNSRTVTETARRNRAVLADVMTRAGFVNYPAEWWHWSYGDQYWAFQRQRQTSLYDSISSSEVHSHRSLGHR